MQRFATLAFRAVLEEATLVEGCRHLTDLRGCTDAAAGWVLAANRPGSAAGSGPSFNSCTHHRSFASWPQAAADRSDDEAEEKLSPSRRAHFKPPVLPEQRGQQQQPQQQRGKWPQLQQPAPGQQHRPNHQAFMPLPHLKTPPPQQQHGRQQMRPPPQLNNQSGRQQPPRQRLQQHSRQLQRSLQQKQQQQEWQRPQGSPRPPPPPQQQHRWQQQHQQLNHQLNHQQGWVQSRPRPHQNDVGAQPGRGQQPEQRNSCHPGQGVPSVKAGPQRWQQRPQAQGRRLGPSPKAKPHASSGPLQVVVPEGVTVLRLAQILGTTPAAVEKILVDLGDPPRSEQDSVAPDSAELAALELGRVAVIRAASGKAGSRRAAAGAALAPRPAVVTVMGHVDHGKTSLLDALRSTSVAAREAGGITQHVGAFEVIMPGSKASLTFLDTPGHAAFSAMRARGAAVTDIVVLVVAAEDGVMPQTKEALAHAHAAGCPIVVAITKCDLPSADPDRVRRQLSAEGLLLEGAGGTAQCVEVAATAGLGLGELEEALLLEAEMMELAADPQAPPAGTVIEARMDRGQGPVVTVVMTRGTLKVGQPMVVGAEWGKVRALKGAGGGTVGPEGVTPGRPVEVVGLKALPHAGDELLGVASEDRAQRVSRARTDRSEWRRLAARARMMAPPPPPARGGQEGDPPLLRVLPLVLKADVQGSAEAVADAVRALSTDAVAVAVVHAGVGPITLSDVSLAVPTGAHVVGFNVKAAAEAEAEAKQHGVGVHCRRVIYELLADVAALVEGASPRVRQLVVAGAAEVVAVFELPARRGAAAKAASVAGCRVVEGSVRAELAFRVVRGGDVVHEGPCTSLRRHKQGVDAVGKGTECGLVLEGFDGFRPGDVVHCIEEK